MTDKNVIKIMKKLEIAASRKIQQIKENSNDDFDYNSTIVKYHFIENIFNIVEDYNTDKNYTVNYKINKVYTSQFHFFEMMACLSINDIIKLLENISAKKESKCEFFNWYMTIFLNYFNKDDNAINFYFMSIYFSYVVLYLNQGFDFEQALKMVAINKYKLNDYINMPAKDNIMAKFHIFSERAKVILENEAPLLEKLDLIQQLFGFKLDFMQDLSNQITEEKFNQELINNQNDLATDVKEIVNKNPIDLDLKPEVNLSKNNELNKEYREKYERLATYIDIHTLKPLRVLNNEEFLDVLSLANELFTEWEVKKLKSEIFSFNKQVKHQELALQQKKYINALNMILSDEQLNIRENLLAYLKNSKDIQGYNIIINNFLAEIDSLLKEFIAVNDELLIPDYKEQIDLIFAELDPYLQYINVGLELNGAKRD